MDYWSCIPSSPVRNFIAVTCTVSLYMLFKMRTSVRISATERKTSFEFELENAPNFMDHENDLVL